MWEASAQPGMQCPVCHTLWDDPLEWDCKSVIRQVWVIESRWRTTAENGTWQQVLQFSCDRTAEEVEAILDRYRQIEKQRCARTKPAMSFEFRAAEQFVEVYRGAAADYERAVPEQVGAS
jgi:hypothetical protein